MRRKGVTLVEILAVLAIVGILVAIVVVGLSRYRPRSQDESRQADLKTIGTAMIMYRAKTDAYPTTNTECLKNGDDAFKQLKGQIGFDIPQDKFGEGCYKYSILSFDNEGKVAAFMLSFIRKSDGKEYKIYGKADCSSWSDIPGGQPKDGEIINSGPEDCQIAKIDPVPEEENILGIVRANIAKIADAAEQYKAEKGDYPSDGATGGGQYFVPTFLTDWPTPPCPGIVYDWDSWPDHNAKYSDGTKWTPIRRVSLRRMTDGTPNGTAIYYHCSQANGKGLCNCNDVYWNDGNGDGYCKNSTAWDPVIENIPSSDGLYCSDLLDETKFPNIPYQS